LEDYLPNLVKNIQMAGMVKNPQKNPTTDKVLLWTPSPRQKQVEKNFSNLQKNKKNIYHKLFFPCFGKVFPLLPPSLLRILGFNGEETFANLNYANSPTLSLLDKVVHLVVIRILVFLRFTRLRVVKERVKCFCCKIGHSSNLK